jgi:hypothetical protein
MGDNRISERTRFVVAGRGSGYVVTDRETGAVVTSILRRREAQREVWERNGRVGYFCESVSKQDVR